MISILLPIHTVSEKNTRDSRHVRARRTAEQRNVVRMRLSVELRQPRGTPVLPCIVTITRIAPGFLDDDNLRMATSGCRDGIADAFGTHDRDPRITWCYAQRKNRDVPTLKTSRYGVLISIETVDSYNHDSRFHIRGAS